MPLLIGTAPNQVPTNGLLGSMAFQNKESLVVEKLKVTSDVDLSAALQNNGQLTASSLASNDVVAVSDVSASLTKKTVLADISSNLAFVVGGLTVEVKAFQLGEFSFAGGTLALAPNGTWYVGVELFSKAIRALPRLGHTGWIPVAKVTTNATAVTSLTQMVPVMPECRIPRTLAKVTAGSALNVVIMGSSLTASGGAATDWPGMVFGAGTLDKYKIPGTVNTQYTGVGGSPNKYQLAQLGFASSHTGYGYPDSGHSGAITMKAPPNGRSQLFTNADLVVIGMLANGGDYRSSVWEPLIRKLRKAGTEVIVVTDNPQGPSTSYSAMASASLYTDGPELIRLANLYGVELADTAAYVFEAHLRAGGTGIYGDSIHMASGTPAGPSAVLPANGHEAWARAVRSVIPVGFTAPYKTTNTYNYTFDSDTQGWSAYSAATVTQSAGTLKVVKNTASNNQWGAWITLPVTMQPGDTMTLTASVTYSGFTPTFGMQYVGWASNIVTPVGSGAPFTATITATQATNQILLFANWDAAPNGTTMLLDNVTMTVNSTVPSVTYNVAPDRANASSALPPIRIVTDYKTPADAFLILPKDEFFLTNANANAGTLGAHPWGSGSFSRKFNSNVGASEDLLTLTAGKKAVFGADCCVGMGFVHYRTETDGDCVINISVNGTLSKTVTIGSAPFANEWWYDVFTPTEFNTTSPNRSGAVEIAVVSGTLKIAAFVSFTADIEYLFPEDISYFGTWLAKENSRSALPGRPTDTLGSYAKANCTGRRLYWILSGNPGSKKADFFSDRDKATNIVTSGAYHIYLSGGLVGTGTQFVRCAEANPTGNQSDGHALHVGGAVIVNDR